MRYVPIRWETLKANVQLRNMDTLQGNQLENYSQGIPKENGKDLDSCVLINSNNMWHSIKPFPHAHSHVRLVT